MPYTNEELKKNEFWLKLHEQDRVDYQKKLEQAETFKNTTQIVDDEGRVTGIKGNIQFQTLERCINNQLE